MRFRSTLVIGLLMAAVSTPARAQSIQLDLQAVPLEEALHLLRVQTSVDIVFAQRLVQDGITTCRYRGEQVEAALVCLLKGTNLHAEQVRRKQYVLVASAEGTAPEAPVRPRGLLAGFVVDAETDEVLPGAHVYLPALRLGTTTNAAGYFALPALPVGLYRVRCSYLGYAVLDSTLRLDTAPPTLRLQPVALEAGGVSVETSRNGPDDRSVLRNGAILPVQVLEKLPSFPGDRDLFQALHWLPGVQRSGEVNGGLIVRGGEPDQNLYLLDGAPVYHPWHAFSLISTFQTETFKEVRLYRGSLPAEHGGRLVSVLDIQMKDGSPSQAKAVAALSVLSGRFIIESPFAKNSSFMISGRRSYLDKLIGREHPVRGVDGRRDTLRTGYYFSDLSAKLTFRSGLRHRLTLSHYQGLDDLDLRLPFDVSLDFSSWLRPAELFFEVDQNWGNELYSARYQYLFSRRFFLTTTAYSSTYRAREGAFIQPTSTASLESDYRVRLRDLGLKVDVDYYHALLHQVRAGVQLVNHRFRSALEAAVARSPGAVDRLEQESRLQAWELVGYVQDAWQPTARWQVRPGLRASFFEGGAHAALNPRLDLRYALEPERLYLHGAAGTQVQYMHRLRDRYSFMYDLVSSRWIPTSKAVRPSSGAQVELGVEHYPRPWLVLGGEVYWRSAQNVLLPEDVYRTKDGLDGPGIEVSALLGQYTPAYVRAYGIELTARVERPGWYLWLAYTGGRTLNRVPALGETAYRAGRFDVPRSLRGVMNLTHRRWRFGLATELRSGYPYTVPVARYRIGDPLDEPAAYLHRPRIHNGRLPPYFRIDVTVARRFKLLGASCTSQLHLYNAVNWHNVVGRRYDPAQERVVPNDRRGLPLLPLLELEVAL